MFQVSARSVLVSGLVLAWLAASPDAAATQTVPAASVRGQVRDQTGAQLPGVTVDARRGPARVATVTGADGRYELQGLEPGDWDLAFTLINFATHRARVTIAPDATALPVDVRLALAVTADVTVTGRRSFVNLADVDQPERSLVGVALAASQGAVTARQLETRPIMRAGDVFETVPGVVISQHSGEGKANQYYLRGFNLDHGTDFSTTVAGMPVNLPTHAHGHGYADANFLIPELVTSVQYAKGPYFAEFGDFSAAGQATVNYANTLADPLVRISTGEQGWARALLAAAPRVGAGHLLLAAELTHNDGPWLLDDDYRRVNAIGRYSQGDARRGFSFTVLGYRATWDATDQIPRRAVESGRLDRYGFVDASNGGESSRYAATVDLQRSGAAHATRATAYGFYYDLDLFSNFTYFLNDPVNGDQFEQADRRFVTGGRLTHRRLSSAFGRPVQQTFGLQVRNDDIGTVGLYQTRQRRRLSTVREDDVMQTSGALFYEHQAEWTTWLRMQAGLRADGYRFRVNSDHTDNGGTARAAIVSPKGGLVLGPWNGTEVYVNGGLGFHSNDARGATIRVDPVTGEPAMRVTPLVRARGAEIGLRTVSLPRGQVTATLWTLGLDSELLFVGDAGTTEAGRPSRRTGVEVTSYFSPRRWLTLDADIAVSRARFSDGDPAGARIPGAVETVVSAGASVHDLGPASGSLRLRYFGPRPLIDDDSVRSAATTLINLEAGYRITRGVRVVLDVFNLFDAQVSDIDYFYTSRLRDEPATGVGDIHFHPSLPRTLRVGLQVAF